MEVHGTEDRTSEWTGDLENKGGWGSYIAVPDAIDYWVKVNGCKESTSEELPLKNADANQVTLHKYFGGKKNSQVWLYEIKGGKHSWGNKDIDTAAEIWKFFTTFVR
jgi:polyhydroxybutyrate depolymerase